MKKIIKKIIPLRYVEKSFKSIEVVDSYFIRIASKNKIFSNVYYLFNSKFSNEHYAVLKGRVAYHQSLLEIGTSCTLLRRNIHRLEKGLVMRPRRDIFAEGFIQDTANCYSKAIKSTLLAKAEKKWATDVLDEYFKVVGSNEVVEQARKTYLKARYEVCQSEGLLTEFPGKDLKFKPYAYSTLPSSDIDFEQLKKLFIRRRSVRWYEDKLVPFNLVQKAANIASLAPSACNRQPYRYIFCNQKDKTVAIAKCAMGTIGFADNLPSIIVVVGDLSAYPFERDRNAIYIDGSLATMQLMLALETIGLSTCPINWPDINQRERQLRKIIELKDYEQVIMLLAVGYADKEGGIPYSQKKENGLILEDISK